MAVEDWLKNLPMAPKSKTHIRSVMHLIHECAMRWELFNEQRNRIALVRIKGGSKRRQRPIILTVEQFGSERLIGDFLLGVFGSLSKRPSNQKLFI